MDLFDLTDDEDFVEVINVIRNVRRQPQNYRNRPDHFVIWNDDEFLSRFRFTKQGVRFITEQIAPQITSATEQNHAVMAQQKVLLTLRFYATGNFLQAVDDLSGIDKSTASRIIWNVTRAIASLYNRYIKMPETEEEIREISQQFYNIARFPKCVGALDCTHIKIVSPGGDNAEIYRNRKGFFSFNVQAICDAKCTFQDVVCRWPGASHDSHIFANSQIRAKFERGDFGESVLVGDSGYGIKKYLITPLANPQTRGEQLFNESLIRTRNCIERKFGQWKRRFPNLAFGIRLKTEKVQGIVIATAVLENIAQFLHEPEPPNNQEEEAAVHFINDINMEPYMNIFGIHNANNIVRHQLIMNYFDLL